MPGNIPNKRFSVSCVAAVVKAGVGARPRIASQMLWETACEEGVRVFKERRRGAVNRVVPVPVIREATICSLHRLPSLPHG